MNIDFILGSMFGFGTFVLTLFVVNYITRENSKSFKLLLDRLWRQNKIEEEKK